MLSRPGGVQPTPDPPRVVEPTASSPHCHDPGSHRDDTRHAEDNSCYRKPTTSVRRVGGDSATYPGGEKVVVAEETSCPGSEHQRGGYGRVNSRHRNVAIKEFEHGRGSGDSHDRARCSPTVTPTHGITNSVRSEAANDVDSEVLQPGEAPQSERRHAHEQGRVDHEVHQIVMHDKRSEASPSFTLVDFGSGREQLLIEAGMGVDDDKNSAVHSRDDAYQPQGGGRRSRAHL